MSLADKKFKELCQNIIDFGVSSEGHEVRPKWGDGVPAHTKSIFHYCSVYDLSEEFPIPTLRPLNVKAAIDEVLWIFQKKSNNIADLNSKIWNQWAIEDSSDDIVWIIPNKYCSKGDCNTHSKVADIINPDAKIMKSNHYGEFYVLSRLGKTWEIQFKDTGYTCTVVNRDSSNIHAVRDPYRRSYYNVGYYGDYLAEDITNFFGEYFDRWVWTWRSMIKRTNGKYNGDKSIYENIKLHPDFESCELFLRWVMENSRFSDKKMLKILQLDKDYYASNCYGPETSTLLTPSENNALHSNAWYEIDDKVFTSERAIAEYLYHNYGEFGCYLSSGRINENAIKKIINKYVESEKIILHKPNVMRDGKYIRFSLMPKKHIGRSYGYQMSKAYDSPDGIMNQVDYVLYLLKNNPSSRRIMWSMYSPSDLKYKALQECAYECIFNVSNGKLNMKLIQRSQDVVVAFAWNEFQYAILQAMIAQSVGLKPGIFVHDIADAHIYDRHIPIAETLINRTGKPAPKVSLNPNIKNFYDFTVDDLIVEDYVTWPQIKNIPVAI